MSGRRLQDADFEQGVVQLVSQIKSAVPAQDLEEQSGGRERARRLFLALPLPVCHKDGRISLRFCCGCLSVRSSCPSFTKTDAERERCLSSRSRRVAEWQQSVTKPFAECHRAL